MQGHSLFLEQDQATQYRPDPRFLSAASILRSASNPNTTDPNSNTTDHTNHDTNTELAPIRRKAQLLLWTHRLLRALQQRTGARARGCCCSWWAESAALSSRRASGPRH